MSSGTPSFGAAPRGDLCLLVFLQRGRLLRLVDQSLIPRRKRPNRLNPRKGQPQPQHQPRHLSRNQLSACIQSLSPLSPESLQVRSSPRPNPSPAPNTWWTPRSSRKKERKKQQLPSWCPKALSTRTRQPRKRKGGRDRGVAEGIAKGETATLPETALEGGVADEAAALRSRQGVQEGEKSGLGLDTAQIASRR